MSLFGWQCLEQSLELLLQHVDWGRPDVAVNLLAVLEEDDCRYVADAHLGSHLVSLLNVALADDDFAVELLGELRNNRANLPAGAAPCCPEVNYKWQ